MVKRKRHAKEGRLTLKDYDKKLLKKTQEEAAELEKRAIQASKDLKIYKKRVKNAPEPIAKRKDRGYGGITAGARADFEARKAKKIDKLNKRRVIKAPKRPTLHPGRNILENEDEVDLQSALGADFFKPL